MILLDTHALVWMDTDDPADRFIVATAISRRAALLTADARMLKWKHALKRVDATR